MSDKLHALSVSTHAPACGWVRSYPLAECVIVPKRIFPFNEINQLAAFNLPGLLRETDEPIEPL